MKKGITFLLTLYRPNESELLYWSSFFSKIKNDSDLDYFILIDNPNLNLDGGYFKVEKQFVNSSNMGKFLTVYNFLKRSLVTTTHIKICDPDDKIDFNLLKEKIHDLEDDKLLLMRQKKIEVGGEIKEYEINSFATSSTILPYHSLLFDKHYNESFKIKNWFEDQVFGILSYLNGSSVKYLKYSWYLYDMSNGITKRKKTTIDFEEIYNACLVSIRLESKSKNTFITDFPKNLDYAKKMIKDSDEDSKIIDLYLKKIDGLLDKSR